jgi:hypothetical protein
MTYLKFVVYAEREKPADDYEIVVAGLSLMLRAYGFEVGFAGVSEHDEDMPKEQMGT